MRMHLLLVPAALLFLGADEAKNAADEAKKDLEKMQGTWIVVVSEHRGNKEPEEKIRKMKVIIKDDVMTIHDGNNGKSNNETFRLDASKKPKAIDFLTSGQAIHKAVLGIYELDGDNLKICVHKKDDERPAKFPTAPDGDLSLIILKRAKEEKKE